MKVYKFLDAHGRGPFTGAAWPVGQWVEAERALPCAEGIHGCRPADVSRWLAHSLWELELDGEVLDTPHKVVGSRGRLIRRVDAYAAAARELAEVGAWRCRDRAVAVLGSLDGDDNLAERLDAALTLDDLISLAEEVSDAAFAGSVAGLATDAAHFARHGDHAQSPFVAACSAGHVAAGPAGDQDAFDAGYATERDFQSAWLTDRLDLR